MLKHPVSPKAVLLMGKSQVAKKYKTSREIRFFKTVKKKKSKYVLANYILFSKQKKLKYLKDSNLFKRTTNVDSSNPPRSAYCNSIYHKDL